MMPSITGDSVAIPMAREPSRNNGSNFSDTPISDAKPAKDSKTGPAMQCTKQTDAIKMPVLSPREPREFASADHGAGPRTTSTKPFG